MNQRLGRIVLAIAALVSAGVAAASVRGPDGAGLMGRPAVQLLAGDLDHTVVAISFPVLEMPADWAAAARGGIVWSRERYPYVDEYGQTVTPPQQGEAVVAVPRGTRLSWRVLSIQYWADPTDAVAPENVVQVSQPRVVRDVGLVGVTALAMVGGGIVSRVVVEVDHPAAARQKSHPAGPQTDRAMAEPVPPRVVNPDMYHLLRASALGTSKAREDFGRTGVPDWFAETANWLRLEVDATGVYRLTGSDMSFMGVVLSTVDPDKLRLFRGGVLPVASDPTLPDSTQIAHMGLTEIPILVEDGGDGEWNASDTILFYGVGSDAWADRVDPSAGPLDHFEHPYDAHGIYWLTWEFDTTPSPFAGEPRRIGPAVDASPFSGATTLSEQWARYHGEESYVSMPGVVADNWIWEPDIRSTYPAVFTLESVVPSTPAQFSADVRFYGYGGFLPIVYSCHGWVNNDIAHADTLSLTMVEQEGLDRVTLAGSTSTLHSGANALTISNDSYSNPSTRYPLALDSIDLRYRQSLDKRYISGAVPYAHWADEVTAPATQVNAAFTLASGATATVWNVSNPDSVFALNGEVTAGDPQTLTVGLLRDPGTSVHLLVFEPSDLLAVHAGQRVTPRPLREVTPAVDYIAVYNPRFQNAAQALADLRSRSLAGVTSPQAIAVSTDDIYANFAGGRKDLLAIRNFLRWAYYAGGQRLRWACMVGDASVDWRNFLGNDPDSQPYDFIPAPLVSYFPQSPDAYSGYHHTYTADDRLVGFDLPPTDEPADAPDVAIGRLTVTSEAQAGALVERIRNYEESPPPGSWRNEVVFCADDLRHGGSNSEYAHTQQAEDLALTYVPAAVDIEKVYLVDFPFVNDYKPAAHVALLQKLNEGTTMFYYVGHGAQDLLADEQVLHLSDVPNLTNGDKRFIFMAFSCDVGIYDSTGEQSMAETFLSGADGGGIAAIAASWLSYVTDNNQFSDDLFAALYPDRQVSASATNGEALRVAKVQIFENGNLHNCSRYNLFGDPATHLPNPVDDLTYAAASMDTLKTGRRHQVVMDLAAQNLDQDPQASYTLDVQESAVDVLYYTGAHRYFWRRAGNTAFRGTGPLASDPLTVPFLAPLQMRQGLLGRVRLITTEGNQERSAEVTVPVVAVPASGGNDVTGPVINLAFEAGGVRVPTGAVLQAVLQDTSGINILGSNPANSLLLEFDGSGTYSDVTDQFAFDAGSYQRGSLHVALPSDLSLGAHVVALLGSDMYGNVGTDTLSFQLVASGVADIVDATVFPNPTAGPCRLLCDVSEPMDLRWDIYTVSGRRVRSLATRHDTAGPKILEWDGRDGEGDNIANGVYLYVLRGTTTADPGHEIRKTGQLVIMR